MQIDIQARGFEVSKELRDSIQKRIRHSFRFQERKVRKVIVRLFSTVGSHGKKIKSCRVQAIVSGIPQLVTEKKSESLLEAVSSSISTSSHSVSKHLNKFRRFRHVQLQTTNRSFA